MSIKVKQESKLYTIEVNEKFAFKDEKTMKEFLTDIVDKKVKHANYHQLKQEQINSKSKVALELMDGISKKLKEDLGGK